MGTVRWIAIGAPMIAPTECRGFSEVYGSWKIIWISRRSGLSCARADRGDVAAVEVDRAAGRLVEPGDQATGRRLAAAGLAHQAERAALRHLEGDAVDGLHVADGAPDDARRLHREVHLEVADLEDRPGVRVGDRRGVRLHRRDVVDLVLVDRVLAVRDRVVLRHEPALARSGSRSWSSPCVLGHRSSTRSGAISGRTSRSNTASGSARWHRFRCVSVRRPRRELRQRRARTGRPAPCRGARSAGGTRSPTAG